MTESKRWRRWALLPIASLLVAACASSATPSPASSPASSAPTSAPASPAASTGASPAASGAWEKKDFSGVTINVVTFTGPPIYEPLSRHAAEWEKLTGATVKFTTYPFSDLFQKEAADLSTGTNSFTLYTMSSTWLGSFAGSGYFEDLSNQVPSYPGLQWNDIVPIMQAAASYGGRIYAVPIDSDVLSVYYRADQFQQANMQPPKTWDEYLADAKYFNGKDLNGDGTPDYGSCIEQAPHGVGTWQFNGVLSSYLGTQGTSQGIFFGDGMQPLLNNDGMRAALDFWKASQEYGPPDQGNLDQSTGRGLMTSGRCALNIDWGDMGTLPLDPSTSSVKNLVESVVMPGPTSVVDRSTGKLVACDATTCPYATDGVNHAPFDAFNGWIGAISAAADSQQQAAALDYISYVSAPAQSNVDVTQGPTGMQPYRKSQKELSLWTDAGMTPEVAQNFIDTYIGSLESPNGQLDLKIPQANQYTNVLEDQAISQFLAGQLSEDQAMQQMVDSWNQLTDQIGRDQQAAAYAAMLGGQ